MRAARKAFTLVEILIVVVILGILAAIVVPQFTNATQDAQAGNLQAQLDTLNNQLELFKARNNNQNPASLDAGGPMSPLGGAWQDLIDGGYIKAAPRNPACPVATGDQFGVALGAPVANVGWNFIDLLPQALPDGIRDSIQAAYFDEAAGLVTQTP
ncbi:MAG: competence type IV pilus major pilin ComGC [Phycisphaerales bacterium]